MKENPAQTTVYAAKSPQTGQTYTVHVSYISEHGTVASSVSEVVWHWLASGGGRWTMVQRILPSRSHEGAGDAFQFDTAIRRAYEIYPENTVSARAERLRL